MSGLIYGGYKELAVNSKEPTINTNSKKSTAVLDSINAEAKKQRNLHPNYSNKDIMKLAGIEYRNKTKSTKK